MKGLSLIELLIAMVVGVFLIGGLSSVYINSKTSDKMRSQISEMEENARVALLSLRYIISHAGYTPEPPLLAIDKPFYADMDNDIFNSECREGATNTILKYSYIKGKKTQDSAVAKRDTMVVVSLVDSPNNTAAGATSNITEDCTGAAVQPSCSSDSIAGIPKRADARVYNYLYINTPPGRRALTCMGSLGSPQPIAENIESIQFLYGVSKGSGNLVYKNAGEVTADEWGNVTIVQVGILVRSEKEVLEKEESKVFLLLDEKITIPKDRRIYRTFTTTIKLPNMEALL